MLCLWASGLSAAAPGEGADESGAEEEQWGAGGCAARLRNCLDDAGTIYEEGDGTSGDSVGICIGEEVVAVAVLGRAWRASSSGSGRDKERAS